MRRALPALVLFLAWAGSVPAEPAKFHGRLEGRVTMSGAVTVDGDLEVAEGAVLTIEPGTRVLIAATDLLAGGFDRERVEIHVKGALLIAGTLESPVRFETEAAPVEETPEPDTPPPAPGAKPAYVYPWYGIVLWPPADPAVPREIHGAVFRHAFAALQIPRGKARVEGSVFLRCGVGVEAGSAWGGKNRRGMPGGIARPLVTGCRFADCGTGVFVQMAGAPSVERSAFAGCRLAVGNDRTTGWTYPLGEPGSTVTHCDIVSNDVGVQGSAIVTSTVFARNDTALALSDFHVRHANDVEECGFRGNVFSGNKTIFSGESDPGEAVVLDDPGYVADAAALDVALRGEGPALPPGLRLRPDSAARGRAADGGDPGALAAVVTPPAERPWTTARVRLLRPLAIEVTGEKPDLARLRPAPAAPLGGRWWCRVEAPPEGVLRLRDLLGRPDAPVAFVYRVEASPGGPVTLEVNGDLLAAEAFWNGERVGGLVAPRRFDSEGAVAPVGAKSGANLLVLFVTGRGVDPRLGVALAPPAGGRVVGDAMPPARDAEIRVSEIVRPRERGGEPWLSVTVATPLSWVPGGRVLLRTTEGGEIRSGVARPVIESRHVLRFGPLPEAAQGGCGVILEGFSAPDGAPLRFPATPRPAAPK